MKAKATSCNIIPDDSWEAESISVRIFELRTKIPEKYGDHNVDEIEVEVGGEMETGGSSGTEL